MPWTGVTVHGDLNLYADVCLSFLNTRMLSIYVHVYVPKVYGQDMEFIEITDYEELASGNFGILEPVSDDFEEIEDGLMFMPGIAFDHSRNRIGFGGGYYDRYLARHAGLVTVALAYEFQIVDKIDSEPTDIRPHIIVTESEVIS